VRAVIVWAAALSVGCGRSAGPPAPPQDRAATIAPTLAGSEPADTLVLTTRSGQQVWLAEGRTAHDRSGRSCYERSVEIRRDSTRIKVPLLFVTKPPTSLDAGHLKAELSLDCQTIAIYRVELATGQPIKLEDKP